MQRKDEILAKKAKLAELKRQREQREQRQKDSGQRDLITGQSSEVPCPCYNQYLVDFHSCLEDYSLYSCSNDR